MGRLFKEPSFPFAEAASAFCGCQASVHVRHSKRLLGKRSTYPGNCFRIRNINQRNKGSYFGREVCILIAIGTDWKQKREDLRSQRAAVNAQFEKDPRNLHLAQKLKAIDDKIAECTEHMLQKKRLGH
jgi:hypothetical protein